MYDAFISYSHSKDRAIAAALQRVIQTLGKPWWRLRVSRVFRDDTSLSASPTLQKSLDAALRSSRYMILLASPQSAASRWCAHEVRTWLDTKGADTLLIALTEGEIAWDDAASDFRWLRDTPLPPVLRGRLKHEPLWVDLRAFRSGEETTSLSNQAFLAAAATLTATIRGVARDDLLSEEVTQQRRNLLWARGAASVLALLAAVAVWQAVQATRARSAAESQRDRAQRVLDQVIASANGRVLSLAERASDEQRAQREIASVAGTLTKAADDTVARIGHATELLTLAQRYLEEEKAASALKAAEAAVKEMEASGRGGGRDDRLALARGHELSGLALARQGRTERAARHLSVANDIVKELTEAQPGDQTVDERMAETSQNLGDLLLRLDRTADADLAYVAALEKRLALATSRGRSVETVRPLAVLLNRMANLRLKQDRAANAEDAATRSIELLEPLAAEHAGHDGVKRDLSTAYHLMAEALSQAGRHETALAWLEKDLAIVKPLAEAAPDHALRHNDLATTWGQIARLNQKLGRAEAALAAFDREIAIGEGIRSKGHRRPEWLRNTAAALELRGTLLTEQGNPKEAIAAFRRALAIREQVASQSPDTVWQRELEDAYRRTRETLLKSGQAAEAMETAEQQLFATSLSSDSDAGKNQRVARALGALCWTALFADNLPRAVWAGEQALALDPGLRFARINYAHALMLSGDRAAARKIYLDGIAEGGDAAADWRKMIRKDFADLAARKITHPMMTEIEKEIGN
jgi:tetratricopeptide (TPR) repeat protein